MKGKRTNGLPGQSANPKGLLLSGGEGCLVLVPHRLFCGMLFEHDYGADSMAGIVIHDSDAFVYRFGDP